MTLSAASPAWLVATPIAHRGLHDSRAGRIENSISAARAAIDHGFAIECDVQLSADGEAMVFHDAGLARLTNQAGSMAQWRRCDAEALILTGSGDHIPSLPAFLDVIGGAVPLICEVKSRFDGDMRLTERVAEIVTHYSGPVAIKSFDPAIIRHLRSVGTRAPLGIVSEAGFDDPEWHDLGEVMRRCLSQALHFGETRPDFVSFHVGDLPHAVPYLSRAMLGLPVMAWTVRTPDQRRNAAAWADQMIFEGFVP